MKTILSICISLIISHFCMAQPVFQDTTFVVESKYGDRIFHQVKDFNQDSFLDTLKYFYSGGSNFGGWTAQLIEGKNRQLFVIDFNSCFCQIVQPVFYPKAFFEKKNHPFKVAIEAAIFPEKKLKPDASLDWIIRANFNNKTLPDHSFFEKIYFPKIKWHRGKAKLPKISWTPMHKDTLLQLTPVMERPDPKLATLAEQGGLIYFAHNHYRGEQADSLVEVGKSGIFKIYKTSHGILVRKKTEYAWFFVTDVRLTGGPGKLRWESIQQVKWLGNYLIIQQQRPPVETSKIFVLNMNTGRVAKTNFEPAANTLFEISPDKKLVWKKFDPNTGESGETMFFSLGKIFRALDGFGK